MKIKMENLAAILLGTAIMGFGVNSFNIANGLAEGGLTGITILLKYMFNIDPGLSNLLFNIPLFFIGWKVFGRTAFLYTVFGTLMLSLFLWAFGSFRIELSDTLLASLYAGVAMGLGLGVIFRYGGTTGGVDIIARWFYMSFGWSIGRTMFFIDILVLIASLIYLEHERAMYTLVAIFISTRVLDFVQQGAYSGKAAMIISDEAPRISDKIGNEMKRGTTMLKSRGGYTGSDREVLYCVVSRNELMRLKNLVSTVDPHAFIIVNNIHEVLGEGFTLDKDKKPLG